MKQRSLSLVLTLMVLVSLGLTYLQIYTPTSVTKAIRELTHTTERQADKNKRLQYKITDYYDSTSVTFDQVVRPTSYYYGENQAFYWLTGKEIDQTLTAQLTSRPIEVDHPNRVKQMENYITLFEGDYLEVNFAEPLPLGLLGSFVAVDEGDEQAFRMNQLIIPLDNTRNVWLANSQTHEYLEGLVSEPQIKVALRDTINKHRNIAIGMKRYYGKNRYIYLPQQGLEEFSRLYTLEEVPDSVFASKMFADDFNSTISNKTDGATRYGNYRYGLEINSNAKRLTYTINQIENNESANLIKGIRDSFGLVQNYDYWLGDMRLAQIDDNQVIYRHFIDNYPIYSAPSLPDYAGTYVQLKPEAGYSAQSYQASTVIPQAYIDDLVQPYHLQSADEVNAQLEHLGMDLTQFESAMVGYEWQTDMEDYRKVILVPKWYLSFNRKYYALDQLDSDAFKQVYGQNKPKESEGQ